MSMLSIQKRLLRLESRRSFLDWFVWHRFYATLTSEELETCASGGGFPDPIPNRPSSVDSLDRKSLLTLWEEDEAKFRGRSQEELDFYAENASWPEQIGRLHYSKQDGKMSVEWRNDLTEQSTAPGATVTGADKTVESHFGGPNGTATRARGNGQARASSNGIERVGAA